jgi:DNA repair exonuclease SbcCD ATPase subunit
VDEDRLLSRIDLLEKKLLCFSKPLSEDKLREEIMKLQNEKMLYQTSAKHALKKVYNERMEAIQKLGSVENALCSTEDECSLMKDQLTKTQTHSQETTQRLDAMQTQLDVKVTDYEEKIFKKETELKSLNTELSELQEKLGNYKVSSLLELTLMNALAETFLFFAATERHRRLRELATCYKLASQIRHQEH